MSEGDEYDLRRALVRERQLLEMLERSESKIAYLKKDIAAQREQIESLRGYVDDLVTERREGKNG